MIKETDKYLEGLMQIEVTHIVEYPLRQKMDEQNMSIRKLGKLANVHYTYISRLLKGKSRASSQVAWRIKDALGDNKQVPGETDTCSDCGKQIIEEDCARNVCNGCRLEL